MSLLLDALKRAEEAKRAKAEITTSAPAPAPADMRETSANNAPNTPPVNELAPSASATAKPADYSALSLSALESDEPSARASATSSSLVASPTALSTAPPVASSATERTTTSIKPLALSYDDSLGSVRAAPLAGTNAISAEEIALAELLQIDLDNNASYRSAPNTSPATAAYRAARSQTSATAAAARTTTVGKTDGATVADANGIEPVTTHIEQAQRDAVKNAFSVKKSTRKNSRVKWVIPVVAGLVFFVGAGSWYVWQEVNQAAQPRLASVPNPTAAQTSPTPLAAAQSPTFAPNTGVANTASDPAKAATAATSVDVAADAADAADAAKAELDALPPLLPPPAIAVATPLLPKNKAATVTFTPREALAKKIEDLPVSPPNSVNSVRLRPAKLEASVGLNPTIAAAYAALNRGDYAAAKQTYALAIAQQPANLDANLGFATAAARSGETEMALRYYRRVLDLDPRNATAAAALLTLDNRNAGSQSSGQTSVESTLRLLIEKEPTVAASHFALGNLFAGERRWHEAQQAFFEAARLTPLNPDYLYNLAVSLDNLGQSKQAEDFYLRALAAQANSQTQFDRAAVEKRLSAIAANNAANKTASAAAIK